MKTNGESLRIGVIGLGNIGEAHGYHVNESSAQLVGGVDISAEARQSYEDRFGVPTFESFEDLRNQDIDAVIIGTPNKFHAEYAIPALNCGIHVLCEKPLAHTLESAEKIVEASTVSDAFLMAGFHNRFSPITEAVVGARESGRFGELRHVDANYIRRRGVPGRGSWFTRKELSGGGALVDIGVHAIDLALHILDYPEVNEVSGTTQSEFGCRDEYVYNHMHGEDQGSEHFNVEDSAIAFIRCESEQTISLDVAWATNRDESQYFVVRGTDAGARFTLDGQSIDFYETHPDSEQQLPIVTEYVEDVATKRVEHEYFFECIRENRPPKQNTAEQSLTVQRILEAIYESSQTGESISF